MLRRLRLIPQDDRFFDLFNRSAENTLEGARILHDLLTNYVDVERKARHLKDIEHTGEYVEIDRPRRLVFTFAVKKFSAQSTRVSIDIVPQGTGCHLTLTHEDVLPDYADRTQAGWTSILDKLAATLG